MKDKPRGNAQEDFVYALYQYKSEKSGEIDFIEIRELRKEEWRAVVTAHREIYKLTRGFDAFPSFAWGDLCNVRDELLRQLREQTPNEWMMPLIEYRILNYSTSLKLYHEHVIAQMNRTNDEEAKQKALAMFSEVYDRSFGYRLVYSMRNAFQHGVRGLFNLKMSARLKDGSDNETQSTVHAYLAKEVFASSRSNSSVRREVNEMEAPIDLFELSEEAFDDVQMLHSRLIPLLHPKAAESAELILQYFWELKGHKPNFHRYRRGLPMEDLGITTLDQGGFDYVVRQAGHRVTYDGDPPNEIQDVLPTYCSQKTE